MRPTARLTQAGARGTRAAANQLLAGASPPAGTTSKRIPMAQHVHPGAGKLAPVDELISPEQQVRAFAGPANAPVAFGTSGHRGRAVSASFNHDHIVAIAHAVADVRAEAGVDGPLFIGWDSHALSQPAAEVARDVLLSRGVDVVVQSGGELVATPVMSRSILRHNADRHASRADGLILTPSHNPPTDGGIKYNPPHGGPADAALTSRIEELANERLQTLRTSAPHDGAPKAGSAREMDLNGAYVDELEAVIDLDAIRAQGVRIGVDPLGGAALPVYERLAARHNLQLELLSRLVDSTFRFIPRDHDGVIRMDCSSPWAMSGLLKRAGGFDVCIGNDPDADRHGIVAAGQLVAPNAFLALATDYLLQARAFPRAAKVGRTVVTTRSIDRAARAHGREVHETPVGFKWFVDGLHAGWLCCGSEESAGLSFLDRQGRPWSTDKDGIIAGLLAAEMVAARRSGLSEQLAHFERRYGTWLQERRDLPAEPHLVRALKTVSLPERSPSGLIFRTRAQDGNAMGGLIAEGQAGWYAMRPSGTEPIVKIYAESSEGEDALRGLHDEAKQLLTSLSYARRP